MQEYLTYDVRREREHDTGSYACPSSSGGISIVQMYDPVEYCTVSFTLQTYGDWPYVPSPSSLSDDGFVLLHSKVVPHVPVLGANGHLYTISGTYRYARVGSASSASSDMRTGVIPGDITLNQDQAVLKKEYFHNGILQSNYFNNDPPYPPV